MDAGPAHQRARGTLAIAFKRRGNATVLDVLRQEGCLKARFPHTAPPDWAAAITLNTAGGVAGGDRLATTLTAGPGTAATVAAQAAERFYRALPGSISDVQTTLHVAAGATLEWLPQETIFFDRCALQRRLDIHLEPGARFLGLEMLVFGRTAMNETVHQASIRDRITLHRAGRLVLHDAIRLDGPVAATLDRPAVARGARAVATLLFAAPEAPTLLDPLRAALAPFEAGVSVLDEAGGPLLIVRIVAADGAVLRRAVVAGLNILRAGRTLPRVWLC